MSTERTAWPAGAPRRYLSDKGADFNAYLQAAKTYASNAQATESGWLWCKPFDAAQGHPQFFLELYQVLNLLQAMDLPTGGRVLEVGAGPGWITEMLVALGYEVHALEPSAEMVAIARQRVESAVAHWRLSQARPCHFHTEALEHCSLPDGHVDGVLFHAALHHVIDEHAGLAQCARVLKPGGVLGVCEGAWRPGDRATEAILDEEMARYGTLENPYTRDYLDHLLAQHGFEGVQRFHGVNGFIPEAHGERSVASMALFHAHHTNNLIAYRAGGRRVDTRNPDAHTQALIDVRAVEWIERGRLARVRVRLHNSGETTWHNDGLAAGHVTLGVRGGPAPDGSFVEPPRRLLPSRVRPGESVELDLLVPMPHNQAQHRWWVDLVNEGFFWFSDRGSRAVPIEFPA